METKSPFLREAMTAEGAARLSPFAGLVAMTGICSQRLINIRRPSSTTSNEREFWKRGSLESRLMRPFVLPSHLKLPAPHWDPNLYFLNMVAHASTIAVHQQALARTAVESLDPEILKESENIRVRSAIEIASIMRAICHVDLAAVSFFISCSIVTC